MTLVPAASPATAATPQPDTTVSSPNGRGNAILNMFQWTWDSVASECTDVIGPEGFGYVQVSPPQEHIRGTNWWTSYQPVSYKIESKLGTRAEFQSMIDTCADAGVGVIVDAVINHTVGADQGSGTGVAGTAFGVDHFPGVPYYADSFNDCRTNISNYQDRYQVQNCRLLSLQDLKTSSDSVRNSIAAYMNDLIGMGVEGFRIDAAKHIPAADLEAIKGKLSDPNIFWVHEVIGASGEPVQPSEYLGSGDSHEFNYARALKSAFDGDIQSLNSIASGKLTSDRAGVFVDNHDTERNGETMNYKWGAKYTLGNVFLLSWPYGSPTVYSGYRFDDKEAGVPGSTETTVPDASCDSDTWVCTQRMTEIKGMVGFYNDTHGTAVTNWWSENNHIAYGRGDRGFVTINNTANAVTREYQTSLPAGEYCDVVAAEDCSETVVVDANGRFTATVPQYGALALHVSKQAGGQCEDDTTAPSVPSQVAAEVSGTSVSVTWAASSDDCSAPVSYEVTATVEGDTASATVTGTSATLTGLDASTTYEVSVVAIDGSARANRSAASASVSVTTGDTPVEASTTVYYSTDAGWSAYNMHYQVGDGAWTTAPGETMTAACTGWVSRDIAADGATITAAFTNGQGTWDNNGGSDYTLTGSQVAVQGGQVTAGNPCDVTTADATASFAATVSTAWGQNVVIVGDIDELGGWDPQAGLALAADNYPVWNGSLDLPVGASFEYKYVKVDGAGNVTWESGANRTATVTQGGVTLTGQWR
ncbi:MAG: carbohydrate-binding module family 20 domain-containing protein [Demequina sp.]|uniref:carbohydrate-binding module family 20 domain-containing protein n=1 Tax=Demequina sp. TaxID=2050685 RepID=UPI003A87C935